jgi:small-conductance mechanosensitive channel
MVAQVIDPSDIVPDPAALTVWDFVWAVAVVGISLLVAAISRRAVGTFLGRIDTLPDSYTLLIARAVGWFVIAIGVIYAMGIIGVDLGPAMLGLLLMAVIIFFAGRGLLENFSAGLVLQGTSMFEVGDEIQTTAGTGTVVEITGRTVTLHTVDGEELNVPNKTVANEPVTNLTKRGSRRSTIQVGVAYGTDLDDARSAIEHAAESCSLVVADPAPVAFVAAFDDNAITIDLRLSHDPTILGRRQAIDEVARAIDVELKARDITIAFPQRTLWWGDPE